MEQIKLNGNGLDKTVYRDQTGAKVDIKDKMLSEKDKIRQANE